jgi:hypothetical protein
MHPRIVTVALQTYQELCNDYITVIYTLAHIPSNNASVVGWYRSLQDTSEAA